MTAIAVQLGNASVVTFGAVYSVLGCTVLETTPTLSWIAFQRPALYDPTFSASSATTTYAVSFQPASMNVSLPEGMLADNGSTYGPRNGQTYGWKCALPTKIIGGNRNRNGANIGVPFAFNAPFNNANPPYSNNTFARNIDQSTCTDQSQNVWEMSVPNGVYRVTSVLDAGRQDGISTIYSGGCNVENTRMTPNVRYMGSSLPNRVTSSVVVQVTDGRLTLQGWRLNSFNTMFTRKCTNVNTVTAARIGDELPSMWYPSSTPAVGAWLQRELSAMVPVGLVSISLPASDCRLWWFLRGDKCPTGNWPLGAFTDEFSQGAVVSVSNTSCNDDNGCPATEQVVCDAISTVPLRTNTNAYSVSAVNINCRGAVGRFVRVHLPGAHRIADFTVVVNQLVPRSPDANQMICYGVEARPQTETTPEYIISLDPADPVFYSTCFSREQNIQWLPPVGTQTVEAPRWSFNGKCLACDNYHYNARPSNQTMYTVPKWVMTSSCKDCTLAALPLVGDVTFECSVTDNEAVPGAPPDGSVLGSAGTGRSNTVAIVASITTIFGIVLVFIVYRRMKHTRGTGSQRDNRGMQVFYNKVYNLPQPTTTKPTRAPPPHKASFGTGGNSAATPTRPYTKPTRAPPPPTGAGTRETSTIRPNRKPTRAAPRARKVSTAHPEDFSEADLQLSAEHADAMRDVAPEAGMEVHVDTVQPTLFGGEPSKRVVYDNMVEPADAEVKTQANWQAFVDDNSGDVYYVDATSGETQWESPLNSGEWSVHVHDGEVYFTNTKSGDSTWEFPDVHDVSC